MTEKTEFTRVFPLKRIEEKTELILEATPAECSKLAQRFELLALKEFKVKLQLRQEHGIYYVQGTFKASVVQACVLTLQDVPGYVHGAINVMLLPRQHKIFQDEEAMNPMYDYEPIDSDEVDLGEIAAQYLSLNLDLYPRHTSIQETISEDSRVVTPIASSK